MTEEEKYNKFKKELKKGNIDVDVLRESMVSIMEGEYCDGFNDCVDEHYLWVQCAIDKLIEEGVIKNKEIFDKICNKVDSLTREEFDEWDNKNKIRREKIKNEYE